eukprot:m51a1_g11120 putative acyltransferase (292) ;mRNA; f:113072-114410
MGVDVAGRLSAVVRVAAFVAASLWCWPVFLALVPVFVLQRAARALGCGPLERWAALAHRAFTSSYSWLFCSTLGIRSRLEDATRGSGTPDHAIFIFNHLSNVDPMAVAQFTKGARFMFKSELEKIVIYAVPAKITGHMSVRRDDKTSTTSAFDKADWNLSIGNSLGMAPEGTRNRGDPAQLLPFKRGAFVLSMKHNVPVQPMLCFHTNRLWPAGQKLPEPGTVVVRALPPMRAAEGETAEQFAERVRGAMQSELTRGCPFTPARGLWERLALHMPAIGVVAFTAAFFAAVL